MIRFLPRAINSGLVQNRYFSGNSVDSAAGSDPRASMPYLKRPPSDWQYQ